MGRLVILLAAALFLALWITSIAHNQPAVGSEQQSVRHQLTVVAGPTYTVTPTPLPTATPTRKA